MELFGIKFVLFHNIVFIAPFVLLAIFFLIYKFISKKYIVNLLVNPSRAGVLLQNFSLNREMIKIFLLILGLIFLSIALLRPKWSQKEELVVREGKDLLFALDVSRSMLAQDSNPNRLTFAKEKIKKIVNTLYSDRVGLIIFSSDAFVQCPLTSDFGAFFTFLDSLDAETISSGTTEINSAIQKAIETYKAMPTKKNKLLILFTDGEDFSKPNELIQQELKSIGMHVFTFGVGTSEGAPIPVVDENGIQIGYQKDKDSKIVISRLDENKLQSIANETDAIYVKSNNSDTDIKILMKKINEFEKEKFEDKKFADLEDKFQYFALLSLLCLLLQWIL